MPSNGSVVPFLIVTCLIWLALLLRQEVRTRSRNRRTDSDYVRTSFTVTVIGHSSDRPFSMKHHKKDEIKLVIIDGVACVVVKHHPEESDVPGITRYLLLATNVAILNISKTVTLKIDEL